MYTLLYHLIGCRFDKDNKSSGLGLSRRSAASPASHRCHECLLNCSMHGLVSFIGPIPGLFIPSPARLVARTPISLTNLSAVYLFLTTTFTHEKRYFSSMFIHDSMATRASLQRRQALGLLNGNVSTHRAATPRRIDSEFDNEKLRREGQGRVLGKHSIDFLDDAQTPKAARYTETHDKRLGIEHWLEDGVVDGGLSCSSAHDDDTAVLGQLVSFRCS